MRIIGGELRGRRVEAPPGRGTRPMLDRVREALFSTLGPWFPGARVLDLFAGSGSLGLEALSRGACRARMVERSAPAVRLLRANLSSLGVEERAEVVRADALDPASWGVATEDGDSRHDVVFLDPPYRILRGFAGRRALLRAIDALVAGALAKGGVLVLHAPRDELRREELGPAVELARRRYGTNDLWYVRPGEAAER